ncbi:peptide ABC transporter substrate-binding protein [Endozoicomonas arenosclerae]|uniref:peptide ABC transporter substrate-binding protein n=1 Tax=Endozoicomonas arenosclerae TaxID=1633495 RepID=UPI000782C437|nr:peptide ABC transporter substrate-binding protein [Endozoicomonas arenosclerae]
MPFNIFKCCSWLQRARLTLTSLLLACAASMPAMSLPLERGLLANPKSLHPHYFGGSPDAQVLKDVYEGLMVQNKNGEPVPGVASDVERHPDGIRYTFIIRDNLKWSDGSPLTADDFVRSFKALADPERRATYRWYLKVAKITGAEKALNGNPDALGIKAYGNKLVIELDQPVPYFLDLMTFPSFLPVHQSNLSGDAATIPVTNGPYKIEQVIPETRIELTSNPNYYRHLNTDLQQINYQITPSVHRQIEGFVNHTLDVTAPLPALHIQELRKKHPVSVFEDQILATASLIVSPKIKALQNRKVRQALSMAIDRDALVKKIYPHSHTRPACSFVAPHTRGFNPDPANCKKLLENPDRKEQAIKLLAESGVKASDIKLTILSSPKYDSLDILPEICHQINSTLGTSLSSESDDWSTYLDRISKGDYDLVWFAWLAGYNDATAFLTPLTESKFFGPFRDPAYLRELSLAASKKTAVARLPNYQNAEAILARELPLIPVLHPSLMTLVNPDIGGFYSSNPEGWVHSWHLYRITD